MIEYYDARATEYDDWWYRRGRYYRGQEHSERWFLDTKTLLHALDSLSLQGHVLELAGGTGIWTELLIKSAKSVTVLDTSTKMILRNKERVKSDKVHYVQADIFSWSPTRVYDAVVFCFWISHVPRERLQAFLTMVSQALRPDGVIFFVDEQREPTSEATDRLLPPVGSTIADRELNDGRHFRIIKNFYNSSELQSLFEGMGFDVKISETPNFFFYGTGTKRTP
jgi:demethylmenaquinone methyltransferase/2-methoxy-6-polyprenyl-1,4-benzoquinol methylase